MTSTSSCVIPVKRATLANGLRIIHSYDASTAMAAVDVLYDTGARDESAELTGMAHLFEHLMFGGSANIPSFDGELEGAGGSSNAWTSNDFTNFYDIVPVQNIETAFHLESDRMLALSFSSQSLEVQRNVVIEEFKQQCLNRPYGDMDHTLRRLVYGGGHPYSLPVIGIEPAHIERVCLDDVRNWFYAHYAPNNAILAVVGNVSFERVVELAEKWFGDIPRRETAVRKKFVADFPKKDIIETVFSASAPQPAITIAFPMDCYGTADYFAADAITDILAVGPAARLYRHLVLGRNDGLFASADSSISGSEQQGMLMLNARLGIDSDEAIETARRLLLEEANAIASVGNVDDYELQRIHNSFEATFRLSNIHYLTVAQNIALAEYHNEDINDTVTRRRNITALDIQRTAEKYF